MADVTIEPSQKFDTKFTDLELEHPVDGDITIPGASEDDSELSTLDEPVRFTVMRDLRAVGVKLFHVLYPKQSRALLKDWDLWGPLVLCTLFAMLLQDSSSPTPTSDKDGDGTKINAQFSEVFALISFGAIVVALNSKLLGGVISFFQSVCVLGYCILPLVISLIVCRVTMIGQDRISSLLLIIHLVMVVCAFVWSTLASLAFLADSQPQHRKLLAVYPIFLFYFVIGWMIISLSAGRVGNQPAAHDVITAATKQL
ncbi:protein YIPF6-like [Patiria miniata]|uniref:Protein YIPF n=1 Tax=Patiria miniata TaxID=46514 RepID=A0A914AID1_PATMI|nr:protein YIPF6-like [Patiria miniata]